MPFINALTLLALGLVFTISFAGSGSRNSNSKINIDVYAIMSLIGYIIFTIIATYLIGLKW